MIYAQNFSPTGLLDHNAIFETLFQGLNGKFTHQRVLALIPDHTRSLPLPELFRTVVEILHDVRQLDFIVALGTHPPMSTEGINQLVGITAEERSTTFQHIDLLNHNWDDPAALAPLGVMGRDEIKQIAGSSWHSSLPDEVDIQINKCVLEYDHILIIGPTFPHEVVGFSGGAKYLFPGISGPDMINATHWLGALATVVGTIGIKHTPVRAMIHPAANRLSTPVTLVALVVTGHELAGVFVGDIFEAWSLAADFSARRNIIWCKHPFQRVLSCAPAMYDELWTAAKAMYKLEPAVALGGEVIIYAPHLDVVSHVHGRYIYEVGYHVLPYFLNDWGRFKNIPLGVLAHSTHVCGSGVLENGTEKPNVRVTLSTKISPQDCAQLNLGYLNPAEIDVEAWKNREDEAILYVPRAGEILYRQINKATDMFIILMGVSGSGKTTIGQILAHRINWPFYDGDDLHPAVNVAKMAAGVPLTDEDRTGWLEELASLIQTRTEAGENGVLACSVLKEAYRDVLRRFDRRQVSFVFLKGSFEVILQRMKSRGTHFMKPEMLKSQFDILEEPWGILTIDITLSQEEIVQKIVEQIMETKYSLGILGLGVMGRSLAQNFVRNGYPPVGFDIHPRIPDDFDVKVVKSVEELVGTLTPPRTFFLMVPAGAPVDGAIASLKPHLHKGDLIIDGGNSYFTDTERRIKELEQDGIQFIGMGVSGGESGALWGPSMMPGGSKEAWPRVQAMFQAIAAKAEDGEPCVAWMGPGGAGHYVKMVHNGIEYGDMQLIAEIYDLLHRGAGFSNAELSEIFAEWNGRELRSYLIEITAKILTRMDEATDEFLVDMILDEAAQKGTGKWTSQTALDTGAPIPTINAAVESRLLSALKDERVVAAKILGSAGRFSADKAALVKAAEQALYASKITSYAQGLSLLKMASQEYRWNIDISQIIPVWRAGCIIRASILSDITNAYRRNPDLPNLLLDDAFTQAVLSREVAWRTVVQTAVGLGIPMLATSASLAYFDAYRSAVLPANLTQAQRDFFGAHTYRRIDREGIFHTQWEE